VFAPEKSRIFEKVKDIYTNTRLKERVFFSTAKECASIKSNGKNLEIHVNYTNFCRFVFILSIIAENTPFSLIFNSTIISKETTNRE